ncbi:MAG: FtsW/RodA/SpoVE family cell cycle protein [Lachnospiraceae bacterium]|nr:FtsW/RodA/SpoVE family cell cycle protein [Lachnospiraceae bacterium]
MMPAYRNDSNRGGRSQVPNRLQGQQRQAQTRPVQRPMYRNEILAQQQMQQMQQSRSQAQPAAARKPRRYYDYSLLFGVIFIFALGLLVIYSSSQYTAMLEKGDAQFYFKKQLMIGSAGLVIAIVMSLFDYRLVKNAVVAYGAYLGACGLLLITLISGLASHGKTRWLVIAGISFQPAEVAKVGLIVLLAYYVSLHGPNMHKRKYLIRAIGYSIIPTILILKQNISSAFIVAMIAAVMLFVAIRNYAAFLALGTAALAALFSAKPLLHKYIVDNGMTTRPEKYWMRRIVGWAAPEIFEADAYQTMQGMYAIGSGGMTGHGLGESIQKFGKIPEVQNDMIFTIICEEFGFIGAATIILLFFYIIYRIYKIAYNAPDVFGTMLCAGVMAHLGLQVALNIAVVTMVIPNTGVTLPFISYGGSAVLVTMAEIGIVLSVAHQIRQGN